METLTTEQLVIFIQGMIIIVLMWAQHKSIPVDKAQEILGGAKEFAGKTPSTLDDSLVDMGQWLLEQYKKQREQEETVDTEAATVEIKKN